MTLTVCAAVVSPARVQGQVGTGSPLSTIALAAVSFGSFTVSVQSGGTQSIPSLTDYAINAFPTPVQVVTAWNVSPSTVNNITLVAYFATPAQALANGTDFIPSNLVEGRVATGTPTAFTAITGGAVAGVGTAGGSLTLFTQNISGSNKNSSRTDNLELRLNLTSRTTTVGTYVGTLYIRAVSQ